jgi:hypothetical protein
VATEELVNLFKLDRDTSAEIVKYFSAVIDFYVDEVTYLTLSDLVTSEGIAALFRISDALNDVCATGICTQGAMEELVSSVDRLIGLFGSFPEFSPSRRRLLTDEEAVAAAASTIDSANLVVTEIVDSILQHSVSMGGFVDLVLSNYEIHAEKGWPLLLTLPALQGNLLLDLELFDGDAASYGLHTVNVRLGEVPAANCSNDGLPCTVTSSSMFSKVYINTQESDIVEPTVSSQGFLLRNLNDPLGLITSHSATTVASTCDANERVELHCSAEDTHGYAYSENITCPDLIFDNSNVSLRCPVYDVVPLCAENGVENSNCVATQVSSTSVMCLCPLTLGVSSSEAIPSIDISGYGTYSSSTRMNSIFGTAITPSEAIIPLLGESGGSQSLSLNNMLSPDLMLFLIPLQILCCCCIILCCIFFAVRRKREEKTENSDEDEPFDELELFDDDDENSIFDDVSDDEFTDDDFGDEDVFMDGIEEIEEEEDEVVTTTPSVVSAPEKVARGSILGYGDSEESLGTAQEAGERDRKLDRWFDIVFEDGSHDYDNDGTNEGTNGSSSMNPGDSFDSTYSSGSEGDDYEEDGSAEYSY